MKITKIKTFLVDGGFRPWTFVKIETDDGIIGWGDCTDWGSAQIVAKMVEDLGEKIIGLDPLNSEYIWNKLANFNLRHAAGIAHKAMAGIDSALWDIKGKYFNAPVWQLMGGKLREELPLYWTHFGFTRMKAPDSVGCKLLKTPDDLADMCKEVKKAGYVAVKTNTCVADVFGYTTPDIDVLFPYDQFRPTLKAVNKQFTLMKECLGEEIGIALDVAFTFGTGGAIRLAQELEPFDPMWLEAESFDVKSMGLLRRSTKTTICIGESLFGTSQVRPLFDERGVDIFMPDFAWNGITMGKRMIDIAKTYDILFAPHNCHSPLTTFVSAQLCAGASNFYLLEFDHDDVPWRDELFEHPFEINNGKLKVPTRPGLGSDLIEEKLLKYPAKEYRFK